MKDIEKNQAAIKIQAFVRKNVARKSAYKNRAIKVKTIGEGIVNISLSMKQPSLLFGEKALPLDLGKLHEVMITRINIEDVSLVLSSNQGTPDAFMKNLNDYKAKYGAVINGGFYAINGFYGLGENKPIGLHRFTYNASSSRADTIKKSFDNTSSFFEHDQTALTEPFEGYTDKLDINSQLHLKTQTPYSVTDQYGLFKITTEGNVTIEKVTDFKDNDSFKEYLNDARYLLSSGPFLVWDKKITFTEEELNKPKYQFEQIRMRLGTHPGAVPPGTFYHADQENPRSAIGLSSDGKQLLMVTVKGEEDPSARDGMTLPQFALLMKCLGAEKALNLDGGYSSIQGVFNNETMFTPVFLKKAGRDKLLPCSIVAKEKTAVTEVDKANVDRNAGRFRARDENPIAKRSKVAGKLSW